MDAHRRNAIVVTEFLKSKPFVANVYEPYVDRVQLKAYGGLLFFRFANDLDGEKADNFASSLQLFDRGTPMAPGNGTVGSGHSVYWKPRVNDKCRKGVHRSW